MTENSNAQRREYGSLMRKILHADGSPESLCRIMAEEFDADLAVILNDCRDKLGSHGKDVLDKKAEFYRAIISDDESVFTPDALKEENVVQHLTRDHTSLRVSIAVFTLADKQGIFGYLYLERHQEPNRCFDPKSVENISKTLASIMPALGFQLNFNPRYNKEPRNFFSIIGQSAKARDMICKIQVYALFDEPVLIQGATGTGKELAANAIHQISGRSEKPFFPVNCAVFTETLAESTLMVHKRKTFTGAVQDKPGIFEMAEGGTVFLDEIGDLTPPIQAMLLRVLQEKKVRRLGENKERKVDFRLLCATNLNLQELVHQGKFRQDLYYRISALQIDIPPLRERKEDIMPFAEDKLRDFIRQYKLDIDNRLFTPAARKKLEGYAWPGNFRELVNVIQHSAALAHNGSILDDKDILLDKGSEDFGVSSLCVPCFLRGNNLDELIRKIVLLELQNNGGKKIETADKLGISLHYLNQILDKVSVFKGNQGKKKNL
jgi:transcriptional regulator with PAS, ATPase and Fis domain